MVVIWYLNLNDFLLNKDTIMDIIPDKSYSLEEQLNSAMRFAIYFTVLLFIVKRDYRVIYFAVFVAFITWLIYNQYKQDGVEKRELFDKMGIKEDSKQNACIKPTAENPFMNVSNVDYADFPNRPKACTILNSKKESSDFFEKDLHREDDDIYKKGGSTRQFFTMPFTTIPNDRKSFQEWLYKTPPTCKENGIKCSK